MPFPVSFWLFGILINFRDHQFLLCLLIDFTLLFISNHPPPPPPPPSLHTHTHTHTHTSPIPHSVLNQLMDNIRLDSQLSILSRTPTKFTKQNIQMQLDTHTYFYIFLSSFVQTVKLRLIRSYKIAATATSYFLLVATSFPTN